MDKYLCLLKPEELYLFQQIEGELQEKIMQRPFSFRKTRENLSLVIVSERPEYIRDVFKNMSQDGIEKIRKRGEDEIKQIKDDWKKEERRIREAIRREKEYRESPENRERVEPWPELPNYEDKETDEPHRVRWNDLPVDDNNELLGYKREEVHEETYKMDQKTNGTGTSTNHRFQLGFMTDTQNLYEDELSNYHLMLLDDRLMQLRKYQQRLNSGYKLGCFLRRFDSKGTEESRTIYLLLDNIQDIADARGVDRIKVLASVYIHELFHAYYSDSILKNQYLISCIREIEETMAEFGMLCFINDNFKDSNDYFKTAYDIVKEKLSNQDLWCYGLGSYLFGIMINNGRGIDTFKGRILEVYHAVQLSIRNSAQLIANLKGLLQATNLDKYRYATLMINLFDIHRKYKLSHPNRNTIKTSYRYFFNNKAYGHINDTIYDVLKYYIKKNNPTFLEITTDFSALYTNTYQFICDINTANSNEYNLQKILRLQDADVVLIKIWKTEVGGNMFKFMKEVDKLNRNGRLDKKVLYLG